MTTTYRIAEVARRSGFSPTTLRWYDDIGLVPAARRSESGHRLYDDRSLDRLAFVDRAKGLGCSLDDIADLVAVWDGGVCGPVQHELRQTVERRLHDTQRQLSELVAFTAELERARSALTGPAPAGPCDDSCG